MIRMLKKLSKLIKNPLKWSKNARMQKYLTKMLKKTKKPIRFSSFWSKAQPLSLHSINSSKTPTMLENSTKPSLADGPKREDEKRKRKVLRNLRSKAYFCRDYVYLPSKKGKADFIRRLVFLWGIICSVKNSFLLLTIE